ncbi:copper resistance CopC family protein [Salinicoccus carnicancri]|uniref:copper resistance CopC family protein n=1 Tax=Salinicoccus carnicancri TaxID=558170 RepID=UPI0002DE909F|nr:copper resistance protein CopC [Salinicoccus carnicancri]
MGRRLIVFLSLLMMSAVFGGVVQAHSTMVSSSPEEGSEMQEEVSSVTMTFDSEIQQEEEIYLENADGERFDYENITVEGETVELTFAEPLVPGDYTVVWEVYGADGHLISGDYGFTVAGDAPDESGESEDTAEEQTEEGQPEEQTDEVPAEESEGAVEDAAVEDEGGMSGGVIALIAGLGIVVIAMIIFFARRRK